MTEPGRAYILYPEDQAVCTTQNTFFDDFWDTGPQCGRNQCERNTQDDDRDIGDQPAARSRNDECEDQMAYDQQQGAQMSIVAPLPLRSRKLPRNGVMMAAPIGNQRKILEAVFAEMPDRLHCSISAP